MITVIKTQILCNKYLMFMHCSLYWHSQNYSTIIFQKLKLQNMPYLFLLIYLTMPLEYHEENHLLIIIV